jgi:hypothetical protein
MAGPGGSVGFICVVEEKGTGLNAQATIGHDRAEGALDDAAALLDGTRGTLVEASVVAA